MRSEFDTIDEKKINWEWEVKPMRGPKPAYPIQLTAKEAKHLERRKRWPYVHESFSPHMPTQSRVINKLLQM
jgi:hypothetical protein